MSLPVTHPNCFTPRLWRIYASLLLAMLYRAFGLSLAIAALITLPLLAKTGSLDKCPIPLVPDSFGYSVVRATDSAGNQWIHLTAHLQVGEQVFSHQLNMFDGKDMVKAVKEGEDWRKCVEKEVKRVRSSPKIQPPPLPRASY